MTVVYADYSKTFYHIDLLLENLSSQREPAGCFTSFDLHIFQDWQRRVKLMFSQNG